MSGNWTPGPWRWSTRYPTMDGRATWSLLGDKHGYGILSCDGEANSPQGLADHANAHLIAAAPDLYAALEAMEYQLGGETDAVRKRFADARTAARAALSKACGETK